MKLKKIASLLVAGVMTVAMFAGCGSKPAASGAATNGGSKPAASLNWKIATTGNEKHQYTIAAQQFADKISELSGGSITCTVYPNSQLGSEREAAEGVKMGSIEMTVVTSDGTLPSWVPEIQVLSIPYLFANKDQAYAVLDGYLQDTIDPLFQAQGFKHLGFCELGFRHFTNNKAEVKSAADMKGLSIRVQEAPIWFALADCLGFIATPIAFNELYTALQQNTVDGQENPITSIYSSAFHEVQKYMCMDGHTYAAGSILINNDLYNGLTDEQKKWVDEATKYASETQREIVNGNEAQYLEEIKAKGTVVCENPDIDSFKEATKDLYKMEDVQKLVPSSIVEGVRDAVSKL